MSPLFDESAVEEEAAPSLVALLLEIHRQKKTGLLHFVDGSTLSSVWFFEGGIQHADGVKSVLKSSLAVEPPGGFSGDLMQDLGQVIALGIPPEDALRAAMEGIVVLLARVGLSGSGGWGFQEGIDAPSGSVALPGSVLKVLIQAIESEDSLEAIHDRFEDKGSFVLEVRGELHPSDGFPPLALRLMRLAAKGQALSESVSVMSGDDPERLKQAWKIVSLLESLGLIALSEPSAASMLDQAIAASEDLDDADSKEVPDPPRATPVQSLSERRRSQSERRPRMSGPPPTAPEKEEEPSADAIEANPSDLYKKAAEIEAMNPLLAIGLDPDEVDEPITPDRVRAAFRKCAASYHPDRLGELNAETKEAAESVFSAFNELRSLLNSQADIDKAIKRLEQERSGVKEITEFDRERARVMGRKASGFMRHRRWQPALELLRQAQALDPENAMLGLWQLFCQGILQEVPYSQAAKAIEELELTGKKDQSERLYRSGWLWKLGGQEKRAMRLFQETLQVDSRHLEAQRELRILQKRLEDSSEKSETSIPFARFFKKK